MRPEEKVHQLTIYVPDSRGVTVSRFGKGNAKIGMDGVYTYSRLPGSTERHPLGHSGHPRFQSTTGTCPGATEECQSICYASRPVAELGPVAQMWLGNTLTEDVPQVLPPDAKIVRIHVSGDFTSNDYIRSWRALAAKYPEVRFFGYTRSWRVPELLDELNNLRALPNVQLFASMDKSTPGAPPAGWRTAWIAGDPRLFDANPEPGVLARFDPKQVRNHCATFIRDGQRETHTSFTCPEQTKHRTDCQQCRYCIEGGRHDVTFLQH